MEYYKVWWCKVKINFWESVLELENGLGVFVSIYFLIVKGYVYYVLIFVKGYVYYV